MDDFMIPPPEYVGDFGETKVSEFYARAGWSKVDCKDIIGLLKRIGAVPSGHRSCQSFLDSCFEKTEPDGSVCWDFCQVKTVCVVHRNGLFELSVSPRQRERYLIAAQAIDTHREIIAENGGSEEIGVWLWIVNSAGLFQVDLQMAMEAAITTKKGILIDPRRIGDHFVRQDYLTVSEKDELKHRCLVLLNHSKLVSEEISKSQMKLRF